MALDRALLRQFNQTISIAAASSPDAYGDVTYGTPATALARVELKTEMVRGADGTERASSHWIATATAIADTSRIWLPGDSSGTGSLARTPLSVRPCVDAAGNVQHYEILV